MTTIDTPAGVLDLQFSPHDPAIFVATLASGAVMFYRLRQGRYTAKPLSVHNIARGTPIHAFAFSPTNPGMAAAALGNGTTLLLQIPDGKVPTENDTLQPFPNGILQQGTGSRVFRTIFSVDGKRLYTGCESGTVVSWACNKPQTKGVRERWRDSKVHAKGITELIVWPAAGNADVGSKRRALLTGSGDKMFRVLDMSLQNRPPLVVQDMDLEGPVWRYATLPPLPKLEDVKKVGAGMFLPAQHPDVSLDPEFGGLVAAAGSGGGGRLLIHKQKFEEIFLPRRDGSDIVDWKTSDGVLMDHEGREKKYWWYDLADIEEHEGGEVVAVEAVGIVDYDPLFKDAGEQRLRRGWRVCSIDRGGRLCFWQAYVE